VKEVQAVLDEVISKLWWVGVGLARKEGLDRGNELEIYG